MRKSTRRAAGSVAATVALVLVVLHGAPVAAQQNIESLKQQMVGTWALTAQWVEQDGKRIERFGSNPKGLAIYDAGGRFATVLMRPDLPKVASNNVMTATPEENKAIVTGSTAFYGSWTIDKDGVLVSTIEGATFPNWDGLVQKRTLTMSGDEVKACVPGAQIGGTACSTWRRVK